MRCPKCGTSFMVRAPGDAAAPPAPAAPSGAPRPAKGTVVGVGIPGASGPPMGATSPNRTEKGTMLGQPMPANVAAAIAAAKSSTAAGSAPAPGAAPRRATMQFDEKPEGSALP